MPCVGTTKAILVGGAAMAAKSKLMITAAAITGVLLGVAADRSVLAPPAPPVNTVADARPEGDSEASLGAPRLEGSGPRADATTANDRDTSAATTSHAGPHHGGAGRIVGVVRAADGSPVAGVAVALARADSHRPPEGVPLGRHVMSGSDGRYEVDRLRSGRYHVTASLDGFDVRASDRAGGRWIAVGGTVDFVAMALGRLNVRIVGPAGEAIDEARVVARREDGFLHTSWWTPEAPTLSLPGGTYVLEAVGTDESAASAPVVVPSADAGPVVLRLQTRPVLMGRVLLPPGSREHFVAVRALRTDDGERPDAVLPRLLRNGTVTSAAAAQDFRFRFEGLDPGHYALGVSVPGSDPTVEFVDLGDRAVWRDIVIAETDEARMMVVRVLDSHGALVSDADVQIGTDAWTPPFGGPTEHVTLHADGTFRVRRNATVVGANPRLVVRSRRLGMKEIPLDARAASPIEVRFDAGATLDVVVDGGARLGDGVSLQVAVSLARGAPVGTDGERREVGPSGEARFERLQPGEYDAVVLVRRGEWTRRVAVQRTQVRPGSNRATIPMPALSSLTVEVAGGSVGIGVTLTPMGGAGAQQPELRMTDAEGRVTFELLPAGRYHIRCLMGGALCVATVDVPGRSSVLLEPLPGEK
jgi:hypothetical protein